MRRAAGYHAAKLILAVSLICGIWLEIGTATAQRSRLIFEHPFVVAARTGELTAVQQHLAQGDSPEVRDRDGQTPLMIATAAGNIDIVEAIVTATNRYDMKDNQGNTALGLAAIHDRLEIAEILIEAGASPNVQNRQGVTPLMLAAKEGRLIQVELMMQRNPDLSLRDYTGRSLLGVARQGRDPRIVRYLEKLGLQD